MPWSIEDVDAHKKGLTDDQKKKWVAIANTALAKCEKDGGSDCDQKAIIRASTAADVDRFTLGQWVGEFTTDDLVRMSSAIMYGHNSERFEIKNVELFATGIWNGYKYTDTDLDEMVEAFGKVGYHPPLKPGHSDEPGTPALGWVANLKRVGDKLVGDLIDLPKKVYDSIKDRLFDTVSAEIYWNLERNGSTFRRALKAVALLGAEIPAVNLKPLSEIFSKMGSSKWYTIADKGGITINNMEGNKGKEHMEKELNEAISEFKSKVVALEESIKLNASASDVSQIKKELEEANKKLALFAEGQRTATIEAKLQKFKIPVLRPFLKSIYENMDTQKTMKFTVDQKEKDMTMEAIVDAFVDQLNRSAEKMFTNLATVDINRPERQSEENPGNEVDKRVKEFMLKNSEKDYKIALKAVLNADPELKKAYAT